MVVGCGDLIMYVHVLHGTYLPTPGGDHLGERRQSVFNCPDYRYLLVYGRISAHPLCY